MFFLHQIDDICYIIPLYRSLYPALLSCGSDPSYKDIIVCHTKNTLQADEYSCHFYADKVKKFVEQNPEKAKEYLKPVLDAHPKVLEVIHNNEELPKIIINKYFEGYVML